MWLRYLLKHEPEILRKMRRKKEGKPWSEAVALQRDFDTDFNIGFGIPRSDTCAKCDQLEIAIEEEKDLSKQEKLKKEKELHIRNAEMGFSLLKSIKDSAKSNETLDTFTFDFAKSAITRYFN